MSKHLPTYALARVIALTKSRQYKTTKTVLQLLSNHGFDADEVILSIAEAMDSGQANFHKSDELKIKPGTFADIYFVDCLDERWYVKFYVIDMVVFMSCKVADAGW